jgi:hypothetical protein
MVCPLRLDRRKSDSGRQNPMVYVISEEDRDSFVGALGNSLTAKDTAPCMTCSEVNAVASLLTVLGSPEGAQDWLSAHADSDDPEEGDTHSV